jgi:phosphatidylserine/phosphatidylglycerophosphate/cardiolipin synthase-like enzyme
MPTTGPLSGFSFSSPTRSLIREVVEREPLGVRSQVEALFKTAAAADIAYRHISHDEATMVRNVIDETRGAGGRLDLEAASQALEARVLELLRQRDPDGIKSYFSSTTANLGEKVIDAMRETVAEARGKRVDINVMIFAFTDKDMADQILELVAQNPNVHVHLIGDFSLVTSAGGRQPARMIEEAARLGISDRVQIKFKKDDPWIWSASAGRPVYNHSSTEGLNHHKGFVSLIEGRPHRLVTGSFNWSKTAANENYENLFVVSADNPANRTMMGGYSREFVAFFNHPDTLTLQQAKAFKRDTFNALSIANNHPPQPRLDPGQPLPMYVPPLAPDIVDVNHLTDENYQKLNDLIGDRGTIRSLLHQSVTYGPFSNFTNLVERVPRIGNLPQTRVERLQEQLEFGIGTVEINRAGASEMERTLKLPSVLAKAIVAERQRVGDFESIEELKSVPGMTQAIYDRISPRLNDDVGRAFFSARAFSETEPRTGYAEHPPVPVMGADGTVALQHPSLSSAAIDLIRRAKPGDTVKLAMYGLSAGTPEYREIVEAAARGVGFRIVLNKAYNESVASALKRLGDQGLPIEVRIIRGRTMHEKFGVVNDDCFHGSANMSGSSEERHSEDRFLVKNNASLAADFNAEHDRLWERGTPP